MTNRDNVTNRDDSPVDAVVTVCEDRITVNGLDFCDRNVAAHLAALDEAEQAREVIAAISIGVRGLGAMGDGAAAHRVGDAVERVVAQALSRSEAQVADLIAAGQREIGLVFDPEVRSSITARMMHDLDSVHRGLLDGLDPGRSDSTTARFVAELNGLLGPGGQLEARLKAALDPGADGSATSGLLATVETRFRELRDLIVGAEAQRTEAQRGTAKGFAFEDVVEACLRAEARSLGGALVERTSLDSGTLGSTSVVGDCVVTLADGTRVAVEAKHTTRIALTGRNGILEELERAMVNRNAEWSLCVSHDAAYPDEVGVFGIYGNRLLVVDDGSGDLIRVALRWIASAAQGTNDPSQVDVDKLTSHLERVRALATRFSRTKRALTAVQSSIEAVRGEVDEIRSELLDGVDEAMDELRRGHEATPPSMVA
jgi:hypothetical protein